MSLLRLTLLVVLTGLLVGCGSKEDDSASKDVKKTDSELQAAKEASDKDAADQPKTKPREEPKPVVDPPVVDPPVVDPPVVDPPVVDPPVVDPPVVDPPAVDPPAVDPPAVDPPAGANRILDRKKAQKQEVRHSMMGFRNTLLFYTFKDQQAILTLSIGNTDETFPVQGKIHLFDNATTEEGLKKWINNQHSDGLFPDVPTPIFTGKLPEGSCKVTSHKQTGTSENPGPISPATFKNYEVKLSVKEHAIDKKVKLSAFTDTAQVHVKAEAGEVEAEVPILQTWSGGHSNVKKAGNLIIRDAKAWKEQWAKINSNRMPQPPLPKVDFDKQMLIVLFMGEKTTGGHSISVASIRDTGKQIEVAVKRKSPPPGGMSIMVMTQPYCIVAIAKTDKPITFKEAKDAKKPGKAGEGSGK